VLFFAVERRPFLFANTTYLGAIMAVEVVIACLWRFQKVFFPATMGCFVLAATGLPFSAECFTLRWLFLGVGGFAGLIFWVRTNRARHFSPFHLVALFCILAALASASASNVPVTAVLKVASLFLLFLYCSTGGRFALAGHEERFVRSLVLGCEVLVFAVSVSYFAGYDVFGNRNNMGAIIGVVATPVLLWAALVAESRAERQRRYIALALCGVLLYVTACRAAILADTVLTVVLTVALRRPRLLLRAAFVAALFLETMAVANPAHMGEFMDSLSGRLIFKLDGRPAQGVFGSRETPWDETISAVKQHPWFGTGFGTSDIGENGPDVGTSSIYTMEGSNREHGSSYLALAEYMGLLGILPFLVLLVLLIRQAALVGAWMRRTRSPFHYAVPFAMVIVAGIIHAGFEDWLVAAGSYLCVFFWVSAFLLVDLSSEIKADLKASPSNLLPDFAHPSQRFQRRTT
jgi:O-antigen ligase